MTRHPRIAAFAFGLLLATVPAGAVDPPHWSGVATSETCDSSCHALHQSAGSTLTQASGNVNLCQTCHNPSGTASAMPLNNIDKASPGVRGTSHGFAVADTNAAAGATPPSTAAMAQRVMNNQVVCSTCHDQHAAGATLGGRSHLSAAKKVTALGSTGNVTVSGTYTGPGGLWYLVEIQVAGNLGTARFRWSKDSGTSWMGTNVATAASASLDNGITASFSAGTYSANERWEFYGAWPFLRVAMDSGDNTAGTKFCRDCHASWTMTATETNTWSGALRSHPVGQALGTGGRTYDRATPLDGNGATQGSGGADTNRDNDLWLDSTNRVQCYTCHGVHFADSSTATVDGP